jgi:hypothetical protein
MIVIGHQTVRVALEMAVFDHPRQAVEERQAILVVQVDGHPTRATGGDVIDEVGSMDP